MEWPTLLPLILLLPVGYETATLLLLWSFLRRSDPPPASLPPVSILRPLKGIDERTEENLRSLAHLDYPEREIVLVVASPADPVVPLLHRFREQHPHLSVTVVIDPTPHGTNPKVSSLINGLPFCRHPLIALTDADVSLPPDYLRAVVGHFQDPAVGMVTSPYRHTDPLDAAAHWESLFIDTDMIPGVLAAERLEGITFGLGASMVVRREALDAIGGFSPLADSLADDYRLGNLIHRAGWKVRLSRAVVGIRQGREPLRPALSRQFRWGKTMRVCRPGGYAAGGITRIALLIPPVLLAGGTGALPLVSLIYGLHLLTTLSHSRLLAGKGGGGRLPLIPLRDLFAAVVWITAFTGSRIVWRGERFRLHPDGRMEPFRG